MPKYFSSAAYNAFGYHYQLKKKREKSKIQGATLLCKSKTPEFRITPVNSGYYTLQIYPRVYVNMFRVKPRATLGLIFFTVLIENSDKQWKVLSGCLKKLPSGIP